MGVTFNGIEYLYFKDTESGTNFALKFTSGLAVILIKPNLAFSNALNF